MSQGSTLHAPNEYTRPDHELVACARSGETAAFGILATKHQKRVLAVAYRITRNLEDAEDVAQTVFLKAFSRLDRFEGRSQFSTWLTRIAVNESLMLLRGRRRVTISLDEPAQRDGSGSLDVPDQRPSPESVCSLNESRRFILVALEFLGPTLRTVLILRDLRGYSEKEIAEALGVSSAAAKARLHRARAVLRTRVAELLKAHQRRMAVAWSASLASIR